MGKTIIMYLCDGKQCKDRQYCRHKNKSNWMCQHTTNIKHAVNGQCKDPWNNLDRFKKEYDKQTHSIFWVEMGEQLMDGLTKEVYFNIWCKKCTHWTDDEGESPCDECLAAPSNDYSHKPTLFEEAE